MSSSASLKICSKNSTLKITKIKRMTFSQSKKTIKIKFYSKKITTLSTIKKKTKLSMKKSSSSSRKNTYFFFYFSCENKTNCMSLSRNSFLTQSSRSPSSIKVIFRPSLQSRPLQPRYFLAVKIDPSSDGTEKLVKKILFLWERISNTIELIYFVWPCILPMTISQPLLVKIP